MVDQKDDTIKHRSNTKPYRPPPICKSPGKLAAFILLTLTSIWSYAQGLEKSLLWKIEGKGIQPSYLFGTFHILPQSEFELKGTVIQAFNASDLIVMELETDDPRLQVKLFQNVSMKEGVRLDQLLKPEDLNKLDSLLKQSAGMGIEAFMSWKPMMLSSLLLTHFIEGQPASFEATFTQMAAQKEKDIVGLEQVSDQLALFDSIPYSKQAEDLSEMINEKEKSRDLFNQMIPAYKSEDIDRMFRMITDYFHSEKQVQLLVISRNQRWVARITDLSTNRRVFYGVGAGHLGGEQGLINLLKKEGYTVYPVN